MMLSAQVPTIKAAFTCLALLCALLAASGCFSRRYPRLMETHLEVLSLYAGKLAALAEDERTVPAQDWGEFTYPLERARQFARVAEGHYPDRPSLSAFERVLQRYAALTADPDVLRASDAARTVPERVTQLLAEVATVRDDLRREAG
jgi:hypothetical protein